MRSPDYRAVPGWNVPDFTLYRGIEAHHESSSRRIPVGGCSFGSGIGISRLAHRPKAQTTITEAAQPPAPGLRKLTGDDAKRAEELDKAIEAALMADRWDEAIARAEELLALRTRVQGPKHFETVNAEWRLKTLRRVAPMPHEDRVAYRSAKTMNRASQDPQRPGEVRCRPSRSREGLEIHRRLLTDDHPDTAVSYNNVAANLNAQGKYAQAQPLLREGAGDPPPPAHRRPPRHRRAATTTLAGSTSTPRGSTPRRPAAPREGAGDLPPTAHRRPPRYRHQLQQPGGQPQRQGKYAQAQPLFEKALEIRRRCSPTTTPTPPSATTTWRPTSTPRGSTPRPSRSREGAGDPPPTAHRRPPRHRHQLQQPGVQPQRPGEVRPGPAAVREGAGDPPPTAHRRPPRHRHQLQQPGV